MQFFFKRIFFLPAALLAVACALFVGRVALVIWRSIKKPLYDDVTPVVMSPLEIAENLNKLYKWN